MMEKDQHNISVTNNARIIFAVILLEYLLFLFSGVSFSFLYGNPFFSIGTDPLYWIVYIARFPQFIAANQWAGILADTIIVVLLLMLTRNPFKNKRAILLFILMLLFYVTLTGQLTHRNYQYGFFMVLIPFMFTKEINKCFAYEAIRYLLLLFYVSAAFLKISNHSLVQSSHLSDLLCGQFTPYFLEGNTGLRTDANLYLISHPAITYALFITGFIIESSAILGFFTKRFDAWIGIGLLAFHIGNWFIMDIAPFGQIALLLLLIIGKRIFVPVKKILLIQVDQ